MRNGEEGRGRERISLRKGSEINNLSKKEIFRKALVLKDEGRLFDQERVDYEEASRGSIDRFCEIACHVRRSRKGSMSGQGEAFSFLCCRSWDMNALPST